MKIEEKSQEVNSTLLLILTMFKHTTDEQFTEIMLDFFDQLEQRKKENPLL